MTIGEELKLFIDSVFREDQPVTNLLTDNYTYLNQRLAMLYGITTVKGDQFRRVALTDSARWGLLGKGAILMGTSYPNRTAPVLRGRVDPDQHHRHAAGRAAAGGAVAEGKQDRREGRHRARNDGAPPRPAELLRLPRHTRSARAWRWRTSMPWAAWRDRDRMAGTLIDASGVLPDGTKIARRG